MDPNSLQRAALAKYRTTIPSEILKYVPTDDACLMAHPATDGGKIYLQLGEVIGPNRDDAEFIDVHLHGTRTSRMVAIPDDPTSPLQRGESIWLPCSVVATLARYYEGIWPQEKVYETFGGNGIQYLREPPHQVIRQAFQGDLTMGDNSSDPVVLEDYF